MKAYYHLSILGIALGTLLGFTGRSPAQVDHSCGIPTISYLVNTPDEIVFEIDHLSQDPGGGTYGYIAPHHWWIPIGFLTMPTGPRLAVEVSSAADSLLVPMKLDVTTPWASPGGGAGTLKDSAFASTVFYDYEAHLVVEHWPIKVGEELRICRRVTLVVRRRANFLPPPDDPDVPKTIRDFRWMHPFVPRWMTVRPDEIVEALVPVPMEELFSPRLAESR